MNKISIGQKIKHIRITNKMGQKQFADLIKISVSYLSEIENNKKDITSKILINLNKEFKISLDWIMFSDSENYFSNKEVKVTDEFDLLELHEKFVKEMNSIEKIIQILKYHNISYKAFSKEEVQLLIELDEYVLLKPLLILTGKSDVTAEEYEKKLKLKYLFAQKILHSYIQETYNNFFKLKNGEQLSFHFKDLIENELI